ncbi:MAG: peroxiredoxin family protein [Planctomycetes bacterium]|nr:peroxiredoxin family protein [Planctomycetota bacterium]
MRWNLAMLMFALAVMSLGACHTTKKADDNAEVSNTEPAPRTEPSSAANSVIEEPADPGDDEFCLLPPEARDDDLGGKIKVGQVAPDFVVGKDDKGGEIRLSSYRGKTVLLFFWATWCPYCKMALKQRGSINNLGVEVRDMDDPQLVMLGVGTSIDETPAGQNAFLKTNEMPWTFVHDEGKEIENKYGVLGMPTCVVVGRDGKVQTYGLYRKESFQGPLLEYLRQECVSNAVYK